MLTLVGLGLYDERSITLKGRDAVRAADRVFIEQYTSRLAGASVADLEAFHDVEIEVRDRAGVEQSPQTVLESAESGAAVFLVGGDPLVATTHIDLRLRAHDRGIDSRVVHGTSTQDAAAGLTGLQNYRFGKATTLPFPGSRGADVPESVSDTIAGNRARDLHTLIYLDIDAEAERYLSADDAAEALADTYPDSLAVAVARAGSTEPLVVADSLDALARRNFGDPLHFLVVPGALHDLEAEALRAFADAPAALLPRQSPG
ncbi:MAG: diphthine synthase [Halobacteriales archaeon]